MDRALQFVGWPYGRSEFLTDTSNAGACRVSWWQRCGSGHEAVGIPDAFCIHTRARPKLGLLESMGCALGTLCACQNCQSEEKA